MNTMGKVLVWVNLAFSLVTAGLIITVFATRTNWKTAYDKAVANQKVAEANAQTFHDEAEDIRRQADLDKKKTDNALAQLDREHKRAEADKNTALQRFNELDKLVRGGQSNVSAVTEELARRASEVEQLKGRVIERDNRLLELQKEKDDFRHRAVAAELAQKSEQDRNATLLAELERAHQANTRPQTASTATPGGRPTPDRLTPDRYPPPEDVEGLVLEVDPKDKFLTISIGSDAGLRKGNTLEVYRLKPEPKYLGTIQILEVRPKQAVAKPVGNRRIDIVPGDMVARDILSKR